jgi:hypothetical protein
MGFWDGFTPTAGTTKQPTKQKQTGFWGDFTPTQKKGDTIAGMRIVAAQSDHAIHYGTHKASGVYDITEREAVAKYGSMDKAAKALADQGYVAAVRKKGQRGITNNHIHFADPDVNRKEADRLRGQKQGIFERIKEGIADTVEGIAGTMAKGMDTGKPVPPSKASKPAPQRFETVDERKSFEAQSFAKIPEKRRQYIDRWARLQVQGRKSHRTHNLTFRSSMTLSASMRSIGLSEQVC